MDFDRYGADVCITRELTSGKGGNLPEEGYPFFAGTLCLRQGIDIQPPPKSSVFLRFENLHAVAAEVFINGVSGGVILVPPYEIDVTKLIQPGSNEIEIHLVNSLRNMLGPLHRVGGDPIRNWAASFHRCRWPMDR